MPNAYDRMLRTYSKNWCQGFCTRCGTSCADYCEDVHELKEENLRLRQMNAELRASGCTKERYRQLQLKLKRQYDEKCALKGLAKQNEVLLAQLSALRQALDEYGLELCHDATGPFLAEKAVILK